MLIDPELHVVSSTFINYTAVLSAKHLRTDPLFLNVTDERTSLRSYMEEWVLVDNNPLHPDEGKSSLRGAFADSATDHLFL